MKNLLLAAEIKIAPDEGLRGIGPLGLEGKSAGVADVVFANFISMLIGVMTIVGFLWFIIQFFLGAVSIIAAAGDKAKLEGAKAKISSSIIGLIVVIAAIFIIQLVGSIFNIEILNLLGLIDKVSRVQ